MMVNFEAARRAMVDNQIHPNSVTDRSILGAMGQVPRERFVPQGRQAVAYSDTHHQFAAGRWLMAPSQFARLIQLANILPEDNVLDVGALTGYSTAVLARLGHSVVGVEPDADLAEEARRLLADLGIDAAEIISGQLDVAPDGRFDVIVVEGAVTDEPSGLFAGLADGGRLVAIIQTGNTAVAHVFVRSGATVSGRADFNASVIPLQVADNDEFQF